MNLNLKEKLREYRRVLQISRKPTKEEFVTSGKVSALGIFVIGLIGFVIFVTFILSGIV
jgi:protein transport protein SEC61 subunit gamma-like protein